MPSDSFTIGLCAKNDRNRYGVLWFASPLFFDERELERAAKARSDAGTLPTDSVQMSTSEVDSMYYGGLWDFTPENTPDLGPYDSIINYTGANNIILSGGRPLRPAAPSGSDGACFNDNDTPKDYDNDNSSKVFIDEAVCRPPHNYLFLTVQPLDS